MNIIACVKSVRSEYVSDDIIDKNTINPYDLFALESVVDLKKKYDCNITCLSMGASVIKDSLIKCYAIGADNVIWLKDSVFAGSDTVATSAVLSNAIKKKVKYDLIVCGEIAVDGETGQVPAGLAERLNIRYIHSVTEIIEIKDGYAVLKTCSEKYNNVIKVKLPAVISFCEFKTTPEKLSLMALKRAQHKEICTYISQDLDISPTSCGVNGSKTKVLTSVSSFVKKDAEKIIYDSKKSANLIKKLVIKKNGDNKNEE